MQRGEGVVEGGREEGFVKCNKSCLYVCCKKENKKKMIKKKVLCKSNIFVHSY